MKSNKFKIINGDFNDALDEELITIAKGICNGHTLIMDTF